MSTTEIIKDLNPEARSPQEILDKCLAAIPHARNCIVIVFEGGPKGEFKMDYFASTAQLAVAAAYLLRDAAQ